MGARLPEPPWWPLRVDGGKATAPFQYATVKRSRNVSQDKVGKVLDWVLGWTSPAVADMSRLGGA